MMAAVKGYRPGEVALVLSRPLMHIAHGKLPQLVKKILAVHLYAHHHAITHALCTGIHVVSVHDAGAVRVHVMPQPLCLVKKHLMKAGLNTRFHFIVCYADMSKQIGHFLHNRSSFSGKVTAWASISPCGLRGLSMPDNGSTFPGDFRFHIRMRRFPRSWAQ